MLTLFSAHGLFDLDIQAKGDIEIDNHHTVEDIGICLGQAFLSALGDGKQITRYASGELPMDEALAHISIDISGRSFADVECDLELNSVTEFDIELMEEFFHAFTQHSKITVHIKVLKGRNMHHILEACFKAFGVYLDKATQLDPRKQGIPSTKGVL
jgi:imidazoleglycerol-phosphate dehydratase